MIRPALTNEEARRRHVKLPQKPPPYKRGQRTQQEVAVTRARNLRTKDRLSAIKLSRGCESGCCPVHGELFPEDLAFHHCLGNKRADVSSIKALSAALVEVDKCLVLCHICHGRFHKGRLDLTDAIRKRWPAWYREYALRTADSENI
jgi:hypothetical protein